MALRPVTTVLPVGSRVRIREGSCVPSIYMGRRGVVVDTTEGCMRLKVDGDLIPGLSRVSTSIPHGAWYVYDVTVFPFEVEEVYPGMTSY